jgi:hypothetical protein
MLLHQKIEMTNNMQWNLFAEDRPKNSLFDREGEVCSWIVSGRKKNNSVENLFFP